MCILIQIRTGKYHRMLLTLPSVGPGAEVKPSGKSSSAFFRNLGPVPQRTGTTMGQGRFAVRNLYSHTCPPVFASGF